jgi:hypothetical protein
MGTQQHMWRTCLLFALPRHRLTVPICWLTRSQPLDRPPVARNTSKMLKGQRGDPFLASLSLFLSACSIPSSTCDHSRIRHTVVPEISSCTASPPPGTATNRALAATGSEILLAALLLIIPWCTCTLFKPGPDGLPPYHQLISGHDCICSLCSSILASTTTPRQRSSHSIRVFQVPSLEYADL